MIRFLSFLIFCSISLSLFGQTPKIQALKHAVEIAKSPGEKLKALVNLLDEHETLPEDTLWFYGLKTKALALQQENTETYTLAILAQARAYLRWNNVDSARIILEPEIAKYKVEDPGQRKTYFELAQFRFSIVGNNSNYKSGMPFVYDVLKKAELYKDSVVMANCFNTLAAWKYDMDFVAESRTWDYKALSYTREGDPKFYDDLIGIYITLGDNYRWIKNADSATYFLTRAITLARKTQKLFFLAYAYQRMTNVLILKKEFPEAEKEILEAHRIIKLVEGKTPQQDMYMVRASVYEHWGQIDKAILVLNEGLNAYKSNTWLSPHAAKDPNATDLSAVFYNQELAKCYRMKGDYKAYASTLENIIDGKDAFFKANSTQAMAELETKYEFEKKEATIAKQKLNLAKAGYFLWASLIFLFLSGIIVWLIFRDFRRKQRIRIDKLKEEEKRIALKAVADAEETERKRIAADLHDNLGAQLSFIKRNVNFIIDQPEGFDPRDEKKYLGYVKDIAQNAMIDLRETIWVLNKDEVTIQEFGDKLKSYLGQQLLEKDRIQWEFHENIHSNGLLSSGEVMHLFRIVQEIISNSIKHSGANQISIELESETDQNYQLTITDNGKGFKYTQQNDNHYGIENIQNRAREIEADLKIWSEPGKGTWIRIRKEKNNTYRLFKEKNADSTFMV